MSKLILVLGIMIIPLLLIASLAMAPPPQGWVSDLIKGAPMHTEVEIKNGNIIFQNATWYLNTTDHNYHVKGFVKNTVPRAALVLVTLDFFDNATGTRLATGGSFSYAPIGGVAANITIPFDINTGYNASDTKEFKTIKGLL
jgi:hypothetical protein